METVKTIQAEDPHGFIPKTHMTFGSADRLVVFQNYKFFTPGLLYLFGKFFDQPLIQFMADMNKEIHYLHHRFDVPIFNGMQSLHTDGDWNHVLWAIEAEYWAAFESFILSVTLFDSAEQATYRVGVQDVLIPDPLYCDKKHLSLDLPPLMEICVFGVNGSSTCVALRNRQHNYVRPTVGHFAPQSYMQDYSKCFGQHDLVGAEQSLAASVNSVLDTPPVDFRTQSISSMSPEKQQEYLAAIADYKRKML